MKKETIKDCNCIIPIRNQTIDVIRIVACFMVIICHIPLSGKWENGSIAIARFAVPYFMMISGWYLWKEEKTSALLHAKKMFWKTVKFTFNSIVFIALVNTFLCVFKKENAFQWFTLYQKEVCINFLLWNRAIFLSSIMWYLFAMLYVIMIYIFLLKKNLLSKAYFIIVPCLAFNLIIGEYFNQPWFYSGNWLFMGLPFVLLGSYFHSTNWWKKISNSILWMLMAVGIILTMIEVKIYVGKILYIGTIPLAIGIFLFAIRGEKWKWPHWIEDFGATYTPIIFVLHCSLRDIVYTLIGEPTEKNLWRMPFFFFLISAILSIPIAWCTKKHAGRKMINKVKIF